MSEVRGDDARGEADEQLPPQPRIPDVGVLALVPDRFDSHRMSRHQILTRLARHYRVLWVNPARDWREEVRRIRSRVPRAPVHPPPGLDVFDPGLCLPRLYRPATLARTLDRARLVIARRQLRSRGCSKIVLYVWRPQFAPALDRVAHDSSLYHVVDEYTFSDQEQPIPPAERSLLERADRVIIHSPGLLEKKGNLNPCTMLLPNGVDFAAAAATSPEPPDLAALPRPRIGYTGWLKNQLDWELVAELADARPGWSFVFVGAPAHQPDLAPILERIDTRPNVHLLGEKPSDELLTYPQHFDVCVMPYRQTSYTNYIYPLKLHEYLASGRPVVATPVRTLRDFAGVIGLATGRDEWLGALESNLGELECSPSRREARIAIAKRHDWNLVADAVGRVIAEDLGGELPDRFGEVSSLGP